MDYSKDKKKQLTKKEKEFFNLRTVNVHTERDHLISADAESDTALTKHADFLKTFRPEIQSKIPKTFAFYGSAIQYYRDAAYNIANYYPFDGTWEEILDWYMTSPQIDIALLKQFWPRQVGHLVMNASEYVTFYAGPQSISEHEFLAPPVHGESALKIDGKKGNTIEFWLKKSPSSAGRDETILHVGSHPGKLAAEQSAELKISLSGSSGNPFHFTLTSGSEGVTDLQLDTDRVGISTTTVSDGDWHHYAFKIHSDDSEVVIKTYVDGELDATTVAATNTTIGAVDSYMAGRIGADLNSADGNLKAAIDGFRFWKGLRTAKEISKFHDKKIYASPRAESTYSSRLGVNYTFNKDAVGENQKDSLVIDSSGNDVTGRIINYRQSSRSNLSAIDYYKKSKNKEPGDPVLDLQNDRVVELLEELEKIAQSYDSQNANKLISKLPFWASEFKDKGSDSKELDFLLHAIATEFDSVKLKIDSIRSLSTPSYTETHFISDPTQEQAPANLEALQLNVNYYKSESQNLDSGVSVENEIDFSKRSIEDLGFNVGSLELLSQTTPSEETDGIIRGILMGSSQAENRAMLYKTLENTLIFCLKRKGTENAFSALLNTLGLGRSVIFQNLRGTNAELEITNSKVDNSFLKLNSLSFQQNNNEVLYLKSNSDFSKSYIPADNSDLEYTFEGTFIFPAKKGISHPILNSSVFGLSEVTASNNDLTIQNPNRADFQVYLEKRSIESSEARFVLRSNSGLIPEQKTVYFPEVYDNQVWNLALRFEKDVDNKFLNYDSANYKVKLIGNSYVGSVLVDTFVLESDLSESLYNDFKQSHKTVFIGAHKQDITGNTIQPTDIKFVDFNAWNTMLTDEEISLRAQNANFKGSKKILENRKLPGKNNTFAKNLIFRVSPAAITNVKDDGTVFLEDQSPASADLISRYGQLLGSQYNFESSMFVSELENVIQQEFLAARENVPIENLAGTDAVKIKKDDSRKFDVESRPNLKILSFEKSLYRSVSKKMIEFLGGVESYNNVIGEPVNKYRRNYKLLDHLRYLFYENVSNDNQFERYVQYYRWIDKAIGGFLEQMIPASTLSNTGIENVVESHALERNKYQHRLMRLEEKEPKLHANLLAINELLYDWEHGHAPIPNTDENENCLWHKDRKEKEQEREVLRSVLTTVAEGDENAKNFRRYALRNLPRPYKHTITRQDSFVMGSNHKSNKIKEFYKIVNEGKTIEIKSDDFYESISCGDKIDPTKKEKWLAATDVTSTFGYLDADDSLLLPLTFYSSSAGANFENFRSGIQISNNLEEEIPSLQGPFVRDLVGGMPHRRVKLGTPPENRPEAYHIESLQDKIIISKSKNHSSMFYKDLRSSRFYNFANIKQKLLGDDTLVFGNYVKDYEIVKTSGRSTNNTFLVETEGEGLTGTQKISQYVSGTTDFADPQRTRREHVFVTRFTPIGSAASEAAFGRDKVSGEFSVYNTVNYRSPIIREVYNYLSHERSDKFGLRSGSLTQASIHKTNRNYNRFTGSLGDDKQADNYYVTHQIPQNDFGYSWVTASANENVYSFLSKNGNLGHQHLMNISGTLKSSQTILFLSSSEVGAGHVGSDNEFIYGGEISAIASQRAHTFVPVDFANLNTIVLEPLSADTNTLGADLVLLPSSVSFFFANNLINSDIMVNPSEPLVTSVHLPTGNFFGNVTTLNSIILNRQGPYGWPSWKQIKGGDHPIVRDHKKNNIMSIVFRGEAFPEPMANSMNEYRHTRGFETSVSRVRTQPRVTKNYKEIMATNRFRAINFSTHFIPRSGGDLARPNEGQFLRGSANQTTQLKSWFYDNFYDSLMIDSEGQVYDTDLMNTLSNKFTIQNDITGFANQKMASEILFKEREFKFHESFQKMMTLEERMRTELGFDTVMREFNYTEKLFPSEQNSYTKNVRTREKFNFFGWKKSRENRKTTTRIDNFVTGAAKVYVDNNNLIHVFFPESDYSNQTEGPFFNYDRQNFQSIDAVDIHNTGGVSLYGTSTAAQYPVLNAAGPRTIISSSVWVMDSRENFSYHPVSITSSYFNQGVEFMKVRDQGTRGEGILQNDYTIFALGNNCLHGAPPGAPLYNRRIPQEYGNDVFLAGEALYETANDHPIGPCYDEYEDFSEETRFVGQEYSLIPEFTISRFSEDLIKKINESGDSLSESEAMRAFSNLFEVIGAIYHTSSNQITIGSQFFNTYSTSDFMKYFTDFRGNLDEGLRPHKINLRCQAVKKFLPKRGFYPAERTVQISEIFSRCYLTEWGTHFDFPEVNRPVAESLHPFVSTTENFGGYTTGDQLKVMLEKRIANSRSQAMKMLMGPGVLYNSIKTGLAVDYPMFDCTTASQYIALGTIFQNAIDNGVENSIQSPLQLGSLSYMTGSELNQTTDEGIPRIKENVYKRVEFEDLLDPERLFDLPIQDNEPHPSASLYYGSSQHFTVLERPARFGNIKFTIPDIGDGTGYRPIRTDQTRLAAAMQPYKKAINNFAAETVNFFLEDSKITSVTSEPVNPYLEEDTTYEMYVTLGNSGISMYDRHSAFGPPVDEGSPLMTEVTHDIEIIPANAPSAGSIRFQTNRSLTQGSLTIHSTHFTGDCNFTGSATSTTRVEPGSSYEPTAYLTASDYYDHPHHEHYFAVTGSSKKVVNYFYDSRCYTGSVLTIDFQDFNYMTQSAIDRFEYQQGTTASVSGTPVSAIYQPGYHPYPGVQLSIVPKDFQTWAVMSVENNTLVDHNKLPRFHVGFYDSSNSHDLTALENSQVTQLITGSDGVIGHIDAIGVTTIPYVDIRDPNNSGQFKTPQQIAEQFATLFLSNSSGWDAAVGSTVSYSDAANSNLSGKIADRISVVKNGSRVSIFHKNNKYDNNYFMFHTGTVANWYSPSISSTQSRYAFIATGSGPSVRSFAEVSVSSVDSSRLGAKEIGLQLYVPSIGVFVPDVKVALQAEAGVHNSAVYSGTINGSYNNNQSPIQDTYIQYVNIAPAIRLNYSAGSYGQSTEVLLEQLVEDEWNSLLSSNVVQSQLNLEIAKDTEGTVDYLRIERTDTGPSGNQDIVFPQNMVSEQTWVTDWAALGLVTPGRDEQRIPDPTAVTSSYYASASHGYLPYVPPFLDPSSVGYARIFFTPYDGSRPYAAREVISAAFGDRATGRPGCGVEYVNGIRPSNASENCNFQNAMSISASLNMQDTVTLVGDNLGVTSAEEVKSRWVIRTKWETPVLDFTNAEVTSLNLQDNTTIAVSGSPWKRRYQNNYYELQASSSIPYLTSSTGMWHQKGSIPRKAMGYFLTITGPEDLPTTPGRQSDFTTGYDFLNSGTAKGDLAKKFGFIAGDKRPEGDKFSVNTPDISFTTLGQIENKKVIHEAVIAIPFIVQDKDDKGIMEVPRMRYFYLDENLINDARSINSVAKSDYERRLLNEQNPEVRKVIKKRYQDWFDRPSLDATLSLAYQYRMMEKYIFPPHLDFNKITDLPPFLFYAFQFKSTINQRHLADLWQNTYPYDNSAGSIFQSQHSRVAPTEFDVENSALEFDIEFLSTFLDTESLKYTDGERVHRSPLRNVEEFVESQVRWLVFKVKYRGESDYDQFVKKSIASSARNVITWNGLRFGDGKTSSNTSIQFNWPYDFFSTIELAKLEAKVDFYSDLEIERLSPVTIPTTATDLQIQNNTQAQLLTSNILPLEARFAQEYQLATYPYTSQQQYTNADEVPQYTIIGGDSTSAGSSSVLVVRQELKSDTDPAAQSFSIVVSSGYTLQAGSEQVFLNGLLQTPGSANDYTISGTTITMMDTVLSTDSIYVTYLKDPDS